MSGKKYKALKKLGISLVFGNHSWLRQQEEVFQKEARLIKESFIHNKVKLYDKQKPKRKTPFFLPIKYKALHCFLAILQLN